VDSIPLLRYVPSWFPGAEFQRYAAKCRDICEHQAELPLSWLEEQVKLGVAKKSFTRDLLMQEGVDEARRELIKWTAASVYGGQCSSPSVYY